ncbi:MAG: hypothetical protein L6R40_004590 [Gallowayella cf. fulva]|nr:MAG: hypothetical protein L6R40_004590 [Xanthomendoza cf. fulva]
MASPTYRSPATSPPYPASAPLPNPKKRPSLSVTSHSPAVKRRKPTNASQSSTPATSHPLRQTSFPPEKSAIDTGERSPSVDSDATGQQSVLASATGKPRPKKRGRKRKTDEVTVISANKATAAAAADLASATGQPADEPEEEDDDADAEVIGDQEKRNREQQKQKEKADLAVMRRVKLRKETVRRIVNQTLSQSVPPSIVTGIIGYTKLYMGLLVERARDVQAQNAAVTAYPSPPSEPQTSETARASQLDPYSTQGAALPARSFESSTTLAFDGPFTTSPDDTQQPQRDNESDIDRPPEINHNDIFDISSSPPRPSDQQFAAASPTVGLKPAQPPTRQTQTLPPRAKRRRPHRRKPMVKQRRKI